ANGGGAIANQASITIINSTLWNNAAVGGVGGGFYSINNGTVKLTNVTLNAKAADLGGGIFNEIRSPETLQGHLLGRNAAATALGADVYGRFASQGYNLIGVGDGSDGLANGLNGDKIGTGANPINPLLSSLANNGGPTQTLALSAGSPALNAIPVCPVPTD